MYIFYSMFVGLCHDNRPSNSSKGGGGEGLVARTSLPTALHFPIFVLYKEGVSQWPPHQEIVDFLFFSPLLACFGFGFSYRFVLSVFARIPSGRDTLRPSRPPLLCAHWAGVLSALFFATA